MRVTIFFLCVVLALVVFGVLYDAIQAISRLDRVERERDQWQRPADVIQELNLKEGSVVADLGSGVGWKLCSSTARVLTVKTSNPRGSPWHFR